MKWEPTLAWLILLSYCAFSGSRYAENILITYAYGGWSPMDWVNHQLHPENFKADFPSGIAVYAMSSFMHLYLLLARLGANLELLVPWAVVLETLFLGIGAAVALRALLPKASYAAMAVFALLVVNGDARSMELSRFGVSIYQGLYYNVADGLLLLGLAMLFRRRVVISALLLGLGCTVHPVMVGMACFFAIPYILLIWRSIRVSEWMAAGTAFVCVAGGWLISRFLQHPAEVASGGIPADTWIDFVRMLTAHFFPVDIGLFTRWHERYIIPLLCLVALAALYLPRVVEGHAERHGVAWGMVLLGVLSCAGSMIPELTKEPFLIKLALHRASAMLILVSLLIAVAGLMKEVLEGNLLKTALAGALLLSPLVNSVLFPLLPTVCLIGLQVWWARSAGERLHLYALLASMGILLGCVFLYHFAGIANWAAYRGGGTFEEVADAFSRLSALKHGSKGYFFWAISSAFVAVWCVRLVWRRSGLLLSCIHPVLGAALLAVVFPIAAYDVKRKTTPSLEWKTFAGDYLAVQRWAHANTPTVATFMVDPTIYYGWRDFSRRSSFGNLREWLHTSWYYDSKRANFEEGLKRFSELGIDVEPYLKVRPASDGYDRLYLQAKKDFYQKDDEWFKSLSRKYGIGYLVLENKSVVQRYRFEKVFQNGSFIVYRLDE